MSRTLVVRPRFSVDDRSFTVLGESAYDRTREEWRGSLVFIPLDRSLPRPAATGPVRRARRRDVLGQMMRGLRDRDLVRALRTLVPPQARRVRGR